MCVCVCIYVRVYLCVHVLQISSPKIRVTVMRNASANHECFSWKTISNNINDHDMTRIRWLRSHDEISWTEINSFSLSVVMTDSLSTTAILNRNIVRQLDNR